MSVKQGFPSGKSGCNFYQWATYYKYGSSPKPNQDCSHLCHDNSCLLHTIYEEKHLNNERNACKAIRCFYFNRTFIVKSTCTHFPICISYGPLLKHAEKILWDRNHIGFTDQFAEIVLESASFLIFTNDDFDSFIPPDNLPHNVYLIKYQGKDSHCCIYGKGLLMLNMIQSMQIELIHNCFQYTFTEEKASEMPLLLPQLIKMRKAKLPNFSKQHKLTGNDLKPYMHLISKRKTKLITKFQIRRDNDEETTENDDIFI